MDASLTSWNTALTRKIARALCLLALVAACRPAWGIPAFARKYGLRCSACHEAWPKLNNFGQVFKDNGYQLMNDRDSPIWQNPSYFPLTIRITPQWHRENDNRMAVDHTPGDATSGLVERSVTTSGFDLSGLDLWTAGTLVKNISFTVLPSFDGDGTFGFEAAWVRFDNLFKSPWFNAKFGKFELDTPVSEKRFLALTDNGGIYQVYHFLPVTSDINSFAGIGENQLGIELMGHSRNSYTRYAVSLLSSNSGETGLPTNHGYDLYGNVNKAFEVGSLGLQRVGAYGYWGQSPTYYLTSGGEPIPGTGQGNRPFYRAGVYGIWYLRKWDFSTTYMHGKDNAFLGTGTPANQPLPPGAEGPTWNGGFVETHYTWNPQLILVGRYEGIRISKQSFPIGTLLPNGGLLTSDFGNIDAGVLGFRWYPIMMSRAGLALHLEYSRVRMRGAAPVTGRDLTTNSFMTGFDVAF
jgi:hypothetical protein